MPESKEKPSHITKYHDWMHEKMHVFNKNKAADLTYISYFLQESTRKKIDTWLANSDINTKKISNERKQAIYNTHAIHELDMPIYERKFDSHHEASVPECLQQHRIQAHLDAIAGNPSASDEDKIFFLRCIQVLATQSDKKDFSNQVEVQDASINHIDEAKAYFNKYKDTLKYNLFLSTLSDLDYLRNHINVTVSRREYADKPILQFDRSASFGSHKHTTERDKNTAKECMIDLLNKWKTQNPNPKAKYIFMTLIQEQSFPFIGERNIVYNNLQALDEIHKELKNLGDLEKKSDLNQTEQNRLEELKRIYPERIRNIKPRNIIYTNIRQWNVVGRFIVSITIFFSLLFRTIYNLFSKDPIAKKTAPDSNKIKNQLIQLTIDKIQNYQERRFKTSELALRYKLHAVIDLLDNSPDPAHQAAAIVVLANLSGSSINLTCKSGKDRTGMVSALACNLIVALEENAFRIDVQNNPEDNYNRKSLLNLWNKLFSNQQVLDVQAELSSLNAGQARGIKSWESLLDWNPAVNPGLNPKLRETFKKASILADNNRFSYKKPYRLSSKNYDDFIKNDPKTQLSIKPIQIGYSSPSLATKENKTAKPFMNKTRQKSYTTTKVSPGHTLRLNHPISESKQPKPKEKQK